MNFSAQPIFCRWGNRKIDILWFFHVALAIRLAFGLGPLENTELQQWHCVSTRPGLFLTGCGNSGLFSSVVSPKTSWWVHTSHVYDIITHFSVSLFLFNTCSLWLEWIWWLTSYNHTWVTCLQTLVQKPFALITKTRCLLDILVWSLQS